MFDQDPLTYWHGYMPVTVPNTVTIEFHKPIIFKRLDLTARPNIQTNSYHRYQNLCIFLDDIADTCTAENRVTHGNEVIGINPVTVKEVTKIELKYPDGAAAEAAEISIVYENITPYPSN